MLTRISNIGVLLKQSTYAAVLAIRSSSTISGYSYAFHHPVIVNSSRRNTHHNDSLIRLFSTTFQPSPPPSTHGTPVFPNIDFNYQSDLAKQRNNDVNAVFVVTGANRGIGLQFVDSLLDRTKGTVVACCRKPDQLPAELQNNNRIRAVQLDLENQSSIEAVGSMLREEYTRIDGLFNVAGILGDGKTTPGPERTITKIDRSWFEQTMNINVIGPVMLTKELVPLLAQKKIRRKTDNEQQQQRSPSVVVNLSARVGSISDNGLGGWYSYRISKSALNQATRTMALELKRSSAWAIAVHPGTTNTDLSKPFQANVKEGSLFPVDFTVKQLLDIVDSLKEEHSGGFYDWAGQSLSF